MKRVRAVVKALTSSNSLNFGPEIVLLSDAKKPAFSGKSARRCLIFTTMSVNRHIHDAISEDEKLTSMLKLSDSRKSLRSGSDTNKGWLQTLCKHCCRASRRCSTNSLEKRPATVQCQNSPSETGGSEYAYPKHASLEREEQ